MMRKRRIGFVLFLTVGNIIIALSAFYYLGRDTVLESIAVFTSVSTAAYAVLNEPAKPKPLLRVRAQVRSGEGMGSQGLDLFLENIGDALAKDIKITCRTNPNKISLEKNGVFKIDFLAPREPPTRVIVLGSVAFAQLASQNLEVDVTYLDAEGKEQTRIKETYSIDELTKNRLNEMIYRPS